MDKKLQWKVDLPNLLWEIWNSMKWWNETKIALKLLQSLLRELTTRAIKINDKELNKIMIRLALYEWSHTKEMLDYLDS